MRGEIIQYDFQRASGIILIHDEEAENRVSFRADEVLLGIDRLAPGAPVEFDVESGEAVDIVVRPSPFEMS